MSIIPIQLPVHFNEANCYYACEYNSSCKKV